MYQQNRDLITVGAYASGSDARLDEAIRMHPTMMAFLQQGMGEPVNWQDSNTHLQALMQMCDAGKVDGDQANTMPANLPPQ